MEAAQNLLLCDGNNRWFDKTLQLIVFENGRAGFIGEHSLIDATVVSRILTEALGQMAQAEEIQEQAISLPKKLAFNIDSQMGQSIAEAQTYFNNFIGDHHVHTEEFTDFGANEIKKMKFSPDAFVQMCIQYAYRKMTGHYGATYESVQVRKFKYGRTECVRTCSQDSAVWIDSMLQDTNGKEA